MASGLYNLQASISRNLTRCLKHSSDIASFSKSRWRFLASFAISPGFVHDTNTADVEQPSAHTSNRVSELYNLKEREKGDWKNLTLEEKQASFTEGFVASVKKATKRNCRKNRGEQLCTPIHFCLDGQHVYRMSFSQPFHVLEQPADEWKLILAGTFTAMGLMTLGMYMWNSQFEKSETVIGPLSLKKELKDKEVSLFYGNDTLEKAA